MLKRMFRSKKNKRSEPHPESPKPASPISGGKLVTSPRPTVIPPSSSESKESEALLEASEIVSSPKGTSLSKHSTLSKSSLLPGLKIVLETAEAAVKGIGIPGVEAIPAIGLKIFSYFDHVGANDEAILALQDVITSIIQTVIEPIKVAKDSFGFELQPNTQNAIQSLKTDLEEASKAMLALMAESKTSKFFHREDFTAIIAKAKERIDTAIKGFTTRQVLGIEVYLKGREIDDQIAKIDIADATYLHVEKEACMEHTREDILESLVARLSGKGSPPLIWLRGPPGCGKTAIAKSIAITLERKRTLSASFFFDKSGKRRGTASLDLFAGTIAFQLAERLPLYKSHLARVINQTPSVLREPPIHQINSLVMNPLSSAYEQNPISFRDTVIILDGLDECGSPAVLKELMGLIRMLEKGLPPSFQLFLSSRPELEVRAVLESRLDPFAIEDVAKISKDQNEKDIQTYVHTKFNEYNPPDDVDGGSKSAGDWPPSPVEMNKFAEGCGGLILIAQLRFREFMDRMSFSVPLRAFQDILSDTKNLDPTIESEYARILSKIFQSQQGGVARGFQRPYQIYRYLLGAFVTLQDDLPLRSLCALFKIDETEAIAALRRLVMVLVVKPEEPLGAHHTTFKEYLLGADTQDSTSELRMRFGGPQHDSLARACLMCLNESLKRDMINIGPRIHPSEEEEEKAKTLVANVPKQIQYAAAYWLNHLPHSLASSELRISLEDLLQQKLLFWVEFRQWMDLSKWLPAFDLVKEWYLGCEGADPELIDVLQDLASFNWPAGEGKRDPRNIYRNFLPFPTHVTKLDKLFRETHADLKVYSLCADGTPVNGLLALQDEHDAASRATSSAISSDGNLVAVGYFNGSVALHEANTGATTWSFKHAEFQGAVVWIAFVESKRIILENSAGLVLLLNADGSLAQFYGPIPVPPNPSKQFAFVAVSPDQKMVLRALRSDHQEQEQRFAPQETTLALVTVNGHEISHHILLSGVHRMVIPQTFGFSMNGSFAGSFIFNKPRFSSLTEYQNFFDVVGEGTAHVWSTSTGQEVFTKERLRSWHWGLAMTSFEYFDDPNFGTHRRAWSTTTEPREHVAYLWAHDSDGFDRTSSSLDLGGSETIIKETAVFIETSTKTQGTPFAKGLGLIATRFPGATLAPDGRRYIRSMSSICSNPDMIMLVRLPAHFDRESTKSGAHMGLKIGGCRLLCGGYTDGDDYVPVTVVDLSRVLPSPDSLLLEDKGDAATSREDGYVQNLEED